MNDHTHFRPDLPNRLKRHGFGWARLKGALVASAVTIEPRADWHAEPWAVAKTLCAVLTALFAYFIWKEGDWVNIRYVASVSLMMMAIGILLTGRPLAPVVATAVIIAIVVITSAVKFRLMHMAIHAYDVVYYLISLANLHFLFQNFPIPTLSLFLAFGVLGAIAYHCHRVDPVRVHRCVAVLAAVVLASLSLWSSAVKGSRPVMQQFGKKMALSTFYSSWPETFDTLMRGQLFEAATGNSGGAAFPVLAACDIPERPPNIILIHQESLVPPEFFPNVGYDKAVDSLFRSGDGKLHPMRVETYGGASWLTEFSLFAGVSTYSFGDMRPFVQAMMAGRVNDTLPQVLENCGYRNTIFYPLNKNFISSGRFYASIGINEVFDMKSQGITSVFQRDHVYYNNMLTMMDQHFSSSQKPLFSYVITFASHQPYNFTFMPEENVVGGKPGTDQEMHEYLRRLAMAQRDYNAMKVELKARFPNERFLIVHYGDHQPGATYPQLTDQDLHILGNKDREGAKTSQAFRTYYAVEGVNYDVPKLPDVEELGIPYLGTVLLNSAGLPLPPAYVERNRLMSLCGGRYDGCTNKDQILSFHRRLIDSGIMQTR
jgi:hypothetical protein